jgi:hypothetical protein
MEQKKKRLELLIQYNNIKTEVKKEVLAEYKKSFVAETNLLKDVTILYRGGMGANGRVSKFYKSEISFKFNLNGIEEIIEFDLEETFNTQGELLQKVFQKLSEKIAAKMILDNMTFFNR